MVKKTLIILAMIIVLLAIMTLLVDTTNKKVYLDIDEVDLDNKPIDNTNIDNKPIDELHVDDDYQICPDVCVEMWQISQNECFFNECGSGCGPDNITTFETKEECLENI
jgi:hypothetical protein